MTRRRPPPDTPAAAAIDEVARTIAEHALARHAVRVDPEHNLIGALLHHHAATAAAVLSLVDDQDIHTELPRLLLGIIRAIVHEGRQPDPVTVAARARQLADPRDPHTRPYDHLVVVRHLAEVYTLGWPPNLFSYAAQVVEDAYRRDLWDGCTRLAQMADQHTDIADLETHAATVINRWRAFHHRLHLLTHTPAPSTSPPNAENFPATTISTPSTQDTPHRLTA
ncbi:hypothetical protein [Nocardia sp. alder85J]|uniref:hypothetical protein n=1 Tax=Nocardia sp. alder85J TaxID=2862949 RepID=UPI001CD4F468|nr:hypothetical protein [Nocardia sp. alder85J]MCX4094517.1 hypothetical protein [Nocardia sp. alder85J]